jgi:hypothetical protein
VDLNDISQLISNLGFPIFVAGFMLVKQSNDTKAMTETLNELKNAIQYMTEGK